MLNHMSNLSFLCYYLWLRNFASQIFNCLAFETESCYVVLPTRWPVILCVAHTGPQTQQSSCFSLFSAGISGKLIFKF